LSFNDKQIVDLMDENLDELRVKLREFFDEDLLAIPLAEIKYLLKLVYEFGKEN
jgi:hypothetical protein